MPPKRASGETEARLRKLIADYGDDGPSELALLDFVPKTIARFVRPSHLAPVAELFHRARCEPVRAVVSAPPRHGKTELLQLGIDWTLRSAPGKRIGYATYGQRFSERRSSRMRTIARQIGISIDDAESSKANWRTGVDDGGLWATSVAGPATGEGFDLLVIDDPVKDRAEAESSVERDKLWDWFTDVAFTRLEPGGSCIVFMARWHEDDLAGRLISAGWEHIVLPAIDTRGASLWPGRWSVEKLTEIRETIGEYAWASLYQGSPMPRGGALFRDARTYDKLPIRYRIGKGVDFAYSAKTRGDRSAALVMLEADGYYYIVHVRAEHAPVPDFVATLKGIDAKWNGPWHWFTSTTEQGLADLATATAGVHIFSERATVDKYSRWQGVAAAWNAGRVLVPKEAPWLSDFLGEVNGATGIGDRRDDVVDALSSAFAAAGGVMAMRDKTREKPEDFWTKLDRALAVQHPSAAIVTPEERDEQAAAEEKRLLRADEKSAAAKRIDKDRPFWKRNPFAQDGAPSRSRGSPRPPF